MSVPIEPKLEDEAWFQKGVTLLEGRKQERETEEKLRKAMNQSVLMQWPMLAALLMGIATFWKIQRVAPPHMIALNVFIILVCILSAIDNANTKRTRAILAWIDHEREKERTRLERASAGTDGSTPSL